MTAPAEDRVATLFQTRFIAAALIMGPALFLAVAFFLRSTGVFDPGPDDLERTPPEQREQEERQIEQRDTALHWVLLALGLTAVGAHVFVPNLIRKQQGATLMSYRGMNIVRLAVTEGAALFGCVCFLLTGHPVGAGVTLALLGLAVLLQFPTTDRLDRWLEPN